MLLDADQWAASLRIATALTDSDAFRTRRQRVGHDAIRVQYRNGFDTRSSNASSNDWPVRAPQHPQAWHGRLPRAPQRGRGHGGGSSDGDDGFHCTVGGGQPHLAAT